MSVFLLGHLSDLHFAPLRDWHNPVEKPGLSGAIALLDQCLKAGIRHWYSPSTYREVVAYELARYMFALKTQEGDPILDLLVVSGDLATIGEYCSSARAYLDGEQHFTSRRPLRLPGGGLGRAVGQGLVVMPGNHDRYRSAPYLPGALNFENEFNDTWSRYAPKHAVPHLSIGVPNLSINGETIWQTMAATFLFEKEGAQLAVVCCDLSLDDAHSADGALGSYLGQGRATRKKLDQLKDLLKQVRIDYPESAVVLAVHFNPKCSVGEDGTRLIGGEFLYDLCRVANVRLVLCGHTHRAAVFPFRDAAGPWVVMAGSATSFGGDKSNSYWFISVTVNASLIRSFTVQRVLWLEKEGEFSVEPPGGFSWETMAPSGFVQIDA